MGETQNGPFQLSFNASLRVDFQGSRVTSDGGLILVRELDERLGFGDLIAQRLTLARSDVPADRFREDLGAWGGADFSAAIVRDGVAYPRRKSRRAGRDQSPVDR